MNDVQNIIDRQLGICSRFNYDNVLKRLVVLNEESFYGLQSDPLDVSLDSDPPIFACRFAETLGYEHILALANEDGRVAIQNTVTVSSAGTFDGFQCHNNAVFDLAWMPHQMKFVTVSGDHTACLWDAASAAPRRLLTFAHHTRSVKTAAFRPTERSVFATGARDGHILIWDVRTLPLPAIILKPDNCLTSCHSSFAPKTPGSHGKRPRVDNQRATSITGLVFQDDATLLSCGECDGNIKAWDMRKNYSAYKREPLPKHAIPYCGSSTKNGYTNLAVDAARVRLYASCMDNVIYCFNIATYGSPPERRYVGHENGTFYIKAGLSRDGAYLVSGSSDKFAYVWNVKYAQPFIKLAGHRAEVTCAAWCQDGDPKLVTCGDDARHKLWRVGPEFPEATELRGAAEPVPPRALWPGLDLTPHSLKRKAAAPVSGGAKRPRSRGGAVPKSKRRLADLMVTSKDSDDSASAVKRPKLGATCAPEERISLASVKRPRVSAENTSPDPPDWMYCASSPGALFMSPTKVYARRNRTSATPPGSPGVSPASPNRDRIVSFTTPTKNLPDFVRSGEAPHLRLMSPVRRKPETTDWLTQMVRQKKGKPENAETPAAVAPLSPKENVPARRNSATDKTPKAAARARTLLKYFVVSSKGK